MKRGAAISLFLMLVVIACNDTPQVGQEQIVAPVFASVSDNFGTHLTGDEEVPPNDSRAQGQAIFQVNEDETEISFRLTVANLENLTQAHIHRGQPGTIGGVVVWLYPEAPPSRLIPGRTQGTIGQGVITDSDVVGSLAGQGVAGLLAEIRAGNAYVNVHTTQLPVGEVRGHLD